MQTGAPTPEQLSLTVGRKVTVAVEELGSVPFEISDGQVILGFWLSLTITVNVQVAVNPTASVAVQVTVVVPTLNSEPEAGLQIVATPGQLSVAVGEAYVTTALH